MQIPTSTPRRHLWLALSLALLSWGCGSSPRPVTPSTPPLETAKPEPSNSPSVRAGSTSASGSSPHLETGRRITLQIRQLLEKTTDDVTHNSRSVKAPYPWRGLPDRYREMVALLRNREGVAAFWLDHVRQVAIPFAHLSSSLSKDPDNPDSDDSQLVKIASANVRGDDFDQTARRIALAVKPSQGHDPRVCALVQVLFLILSGATQDAIDIIDKLPEIPDWERSRVEKAGRMLARLLISYGLKKGPRPVEWARQGLAVFDGRLNNGGDLVDWEWALIVTFSAIPSFFHEEYGKWEPGTDVVDRTLELVGEGTVTPPPGLDAVIMKDTREAILDAGRRGVNRYKSRLTVKAGPSLEHLTRAVDACRWQLLAGQGPKAEGPLWYRMVQTWLEPALTATGQESPRSTDLTKALQRLDAAASKRLGAETTGVYSLTKAWCLASTGNKAQALTLLGTARQKARSAGYEQQEPEMWAIIDRLEAAISASAPPASPGAR